MPLIKPFSGNTGVNDLVMVSLTLVKISCLPTVASFIFYKHILFDKIFWKLNCT